MVSWDVHDEARGSISRIYHIMLNLRTRYGRWTWVKDGTNKTVGYRHKTPHLQVAHTHKSHLAVSLHCSNLSMSSVTWARWSVCCRRYRRGTARCFTANVTKPCTCAQQSLQPSLRERHVIKPLGWCTRAHHHLQAYTAGVIAPWIRTALCFLMLFQ